MLDLLHLVPATDGDKSQVDCAEDVTDTTLRRPQDTAGLLHKSCKLSLFRSAGSLWFFVHLLNASDAVIFTHNKGIWFKLSVAFFSSVPHMQFYNKQYFVDKAYGVSEFSAEEYFVTSFSVLLCKAKLWQIIDVGVYSDLHVGQHNCWNHNLHPLLFLQIAEEFSFLFNTDYFFFTPIFKTTNRPHRLFDRWLHSLPFQYFPLLLSFSPACLLSLLQSEHVSTPLRCT